METAVYEYRIWLETGDLMGCASIFKRRAWWTVELEPFYTDDKVRSKGFRSESDACAFAKEHAEKYMAQAIDWEKKEHEKNGTEWEEEFASSSYHIQICEDGYNVKL
jgi:hypothetical protein